MSIIKSNESEARLSAGVLKSTGAEAGDLRTVGAAGSTNVSVNLTCMNIYGQAISAFQKYQNISARDGAALQNVAVSLSQMDRILAGRIK